MGSFGPAGLVRHGDEGEPGQVLQVRDLFWRNVMREILTSLSVASLAKRTARGHGGALEGHVQEGVSEGDASAPEAGDEEDMFDGRLAILTHAGERIPIAEVYPLFACGINTSREDRALSMAVECSVFQVRTPTGEVFTLPLQEMRAFHAMSSELMDRLEEQAREASPEVLQEEPFGFAAFTSLSRERAEAESSSAAGHGETNA